jgi:hypothetical protein
MARATNSKVSKGNSVSQPQKPETVKLKVSVDRETARLLRLEAFGRDCSVGQVIAEMVRATPRRFVLVDRGVKGANGVDGLAGSSGQNVQEARGEARPLGLLSDSA